MMTEDEQLPKELAEFRRQMALLSVMGNDVKGLISSWIPRPMRTKLQEATAQKSPDEHANPNGGQFTIGQNLQRLFGGSLFKRFTQSTSPAPAPPQPPDNGGQKRDIPPKKRFQHFGASVDYDRK